MYSKYGLTRGDILRTKRLEFAFEFLGEPLHIVPFTLSLLCESLIVHGADVLKGIVLKDYFVRGSSSGLITQGQCTQGITMVGELASDEVFTLRILRIPPVLPCEIDGCLHCF